MSAPALRAHRNARAPCSTPPLGRSLLSRGETHRARKTSRALPPRTTHTRATPGRRRAFTGGAPRSKRASERAWGWRAQQIEQTSLQMAAAMRASAPCQRGAPARGSAKSCVHAPALRVRRAPQPCRVAGVAEVGVCCSDACCFAHTLARPSRSRAPRQSPHDPHALQLSLLPYTTRHARTPRRQTTCRPRLRRRCPS